MKTSIKEPHRVEPFDLLYKPWLKFADVNLQNRYGWLDKDGVYYGCMWMGHMDLVDDLQNAGFMKDAPIRDVENAMVKLTADGRSPLILTYQEKLAPRQKLTLEKLIEKHCLMDGVKYHLVADTEITMEDGKVKFHRYRA